MKNLLRLAFWLSLLLAKNSHSQSYLSMLDNVNKWAVFSVLPGVERSFFGNSGYFNATDTIIDSIAYKWIQPDANFMYLPDDTLQYFLREDTINQLVYVRYNDADTDFVIYDFNLMQGDSILLGFKSGNFSSGYFNVDSLSTLNTLGGIRKTWYLSNAINQKIVWIEGIGSIYGPVYTADMYCDLCIYTDCFNDIFTSVFLTCAFKDTVQVYQNSICSIPPVWLAIPYTNCLYSAAGGVEEISNKHFLEVYPIPAGNFLSIKRNENNSKSNLTIIDAKGLMVKSKNCKGVMNDNEITIDISGLTPGIYVIADEYGHHAKFIKD